MDLMDWTKIAAYFLWEYTAYDNPLTLWYCVEDMACCLESRNITTAAALDEIKKRGVYDFGYVEFVRKIAFRIYIYTNREDSLANWFAAEKLINNGEWCHAIINVASTYAKEKESPDFISKLRSDQAKKHYGSTGF